MPEPLPGKPTGSARFRRSLRLTSGAQFKQVFARARRSSDGLFTVLAIDNELGHPRLGLAIGKKRLRRAVARNRVKRLVREAFREQAASLPGLDLVVISRFGGRPNGNAIRRSLRAHWARLAG